LAYLEARTGAKATADPYGMTIKRTSNGKNENKSDNKSNSGNNKSKSGKSGNNRSKSDSWEWQQL
jgi:hypothetical protein